VVRGVNHVRLAEVSYTLEGRRLGRSGLVLPVKLLLLVQRDLGRAGPESWRVGRR
jgi:hypothetical protein